MKKFEKPSVLILDDNRMDRAIIQRFLKEQPAFEAANVIEACSFEQALELFNKPKFALDFAIVDYHTPEGTAANFLQKLNELDINLPILALTGITDPKVAVEVTRLGAHAYLNKAELSASTLADAIGRATKNFDLHMSEVIEKSDLHSFARRLAHDLRDPLSGILGLIDILEEDPTQLHILDLVRKRSNYAMDMVNSVLNFSTQKK